jgi:hypothetical protein
VAGCCEDADGPSGSIKCWEFLKYVRNNFSQKHSSPQNYLLTWVYTVSIFWELIVPIILSKTCICTRVLFRTFLTSAVGGNEWSASRPGRFTPGERASGIHWIGGWVALRTGLDDVKKRKFLT